MQYNFTVTYRYPSDSRFYVALWEIPAQTYTKALKELTKRCQKTERRFHARVVATAYTPNKRGR